jgi:hypothetical protein
MVPEAPPGYSEAKWNEPAFNPASSKTLPSKSTVPSLFQLWKKAALPD